MKSEDILYDIIVAIAMYWAKKAGIADYRDLSNKEIGSMASLFVDIEKTTKRLLKGEITSEQAKEEYKKAFIKGFLCVAKNAMVIVGKAIDNLDVDAAIKKCEKVIIDAKDFVKETLSKAKEVGIYYFSKLKKTVKNLAS